METAEIPRVVAQESFVHSKMSVRIDGIQNRRLAGPAQRRLDQPPRASWAGPGLLRLAVAPGQLVLCSAGPLFPEGGKSCSRGTWFHQEPVDVRVTERPSLREGQPGPKGPPHASWAWSLGNGRVGPGLQGLADPESVPWGRADPEVSRDKDH